MDKRTKVLVSLGILVLLGIAFYFVSYAITKYTGYSITGSALYSKEERLQIAKCLSDKGVILYCSELSLNCLRQKEVLKDVFDIIIYLDCNENAEECEDLNIPAWKINNRFYFGIKNINELAKLSGCEIR